MEYAIRQSAAISREGVEVHFLCKPSFPVERLADGIVVQKFVESRMSSVQRRGLAGKIFRVWQMIADLRSEAKQVDQLAEKLLTDSSTRNSLPITRHDLGEAEIAVLFACYKEYFAPFWAGPLRRLAKKGIVIGTIAHDPVRDFVVGPLWWHRWSVRPAEYYQKLAQELGVAKRCRWDIRRIPDEEVGGIFAACDVVLVTYSAKFRSASGVLNTAVSARKPVLASSGLGPLKTVVNQYQLGIFVEPDDFDKILRAASDLANRDQLHAAPAPAWDRYESENSWEENARKVVEVFEA
jgi:hypothetical protein